ncbi:hypothetical protein ACGFXB_06450 [Streptomyces canus]|jgi:hypothetical protein|uniref:hypothetical protein n=1 Tax=Streptomyces canus TaxID=58343 RepID=UPI00371F59A6
MKVIERLIAAGRARPGGFFAGGVRVTAVLADVAGAPVTDGLVVWGRVCLGGFGAGGDVWWG